MYNYLSSIKTEIKIYKCKRKTMQKKPKIVKQIENGAKTKKRCSYKRKF